MLDRLAEYFSRTLEISKMQVDLILSYWDISLLIVLFALGVSLLFLKLAK